MKGGDAPSDGRSTANSATRSLLLKHMYTRGTEFERLDEAAALTNTLKRIVRKSRPRPGAPARFFELPDGRRFAVLVTHRGTLRVLDEKGHIVLDMREAPPRTWRPGRVVQEVGDDG